MAKACTVSINTIRLAAWRQAPAVVCFKGGTLDSGGRLVEQELWTTRLLAQHVRKHAGAAGHASLIKLGRGTVSKILSANQVHPHKIQYYLERRDPEFDAKMVQVLHVYKEVEMWREKGVPPPDLVAVLSYDEKPGIQALDNTAPDRPPSPGRHSAVGRGSGTGTQTASERGIHRIPETGRRALPGGRTHPCGAGQSFRAHLQRN